MKTKQSKVKQSSASDAMYSAATQSNASNASNSKQSKAKHCKAKGKAKQSTQSKAKQCKGIQTLSKGRTGIICQNFLKMAKAYFSKRPCLLVWITRHLLWCLSLVVWVQGCVCAFCGELLFVRSPLYTSHDEIVSDRILAISCNVSLRSHKPGWLGWPFLDKRS